MHHRSLKLGGTVRGVGGPRP